MKKAFLLFGLAGVLSWGSSCGRESSTPLSGSCGGCLSHVWSKRFGGEGFIDGVALAVDGEGSVYLTGDFYSSTINFGGDDLENAWLEDVFLAKFDKDGNHVWSKRFGEKGRDNVKALSVDGEGNVYLTGVFDSNFIYFGGDDLENAGCSGVGDICPGPDIFLAKFDKDGNHVWSKRFGGDDVEVVGALGVDGEGNVYLTGWFFSRTINFGGGDLENAGGCDIFLAKFDKDGRHVWSNRFGGEYEDYGTAALAADGDGNVYLTGYLWSGINFGGGDLETVGWYNVFLAKFDKDGNHVWSKSFRGTEDDEGLALALDSEGNVYITGFYTSITINFGGGDLKHAGDKDVFLAKFDRDGRHIWSKTFGGDSGEVALALAVDGEGNVYLTGYFESRTINFGGGDLENAGGQCLVGPCSDIFLAKFDRDGRHVWSKSFGGDDEDAGHSLAVDGEGNVYLTGNFWSNTINFGGHDLMNAGEADIFLVKFAPEK